MDPENDRRCVPLPLGFATIENNGRMGSPVSDPLEPHAIHTHREATPLAALMAAPPNTEPQPSALDGVRLRELLQDAIESVDALNKWIWDAHVNRAMSFRKIAAELDRSKTDIHRRYHQTRDDLADILTLRGVI
jgi:DNA-directed RNA polymerase specialized sigma24 family protein